MRRIVFLITIALLICLLPGCSSSKLPDNQFTKSFPMPSDDEIVKCSETDNSFKIILAWSTIDRMKEYVDSLEKSGLIHMDISNVGENAIWNSFEPESGVTVSIFWNRSKKVLSGEKEIGNEAVVEFSAISA